MDSVPISQFIESIYPEPPVPLTSELGHEIEIKARAVISPTFRNSVLPREINILSPRAQEFFRRTREASLGHPIEDLLDTDKEEQSWSAVNEEMRTLGALMMTHKADGSFILGARPSYADFFIAGALQSSRVVDEDVFQRFMKFPGFKNVYEACVPFMDRKD